MIENYIQRYYKLSKKTKNDSKYIQIRLGVLKLFVCSSIYNQYYDLFIENLSTRQNKQVAKQLCRLWFFIHFNCALGNSKIAYDELYKIVIHNPNQLTYYRGILERLNLISVYREFETYSKENQTRYKAEISTYQIQERESNLDFSSNTYIELDYSIKDYNISKYRNLIKSYNTTPIPYIELSSSQLTNCDSNEYKCRCKVYTMDEFCSRYNRLEYRNLLGEVDVVETGKLQHSVAYLHDDGRVYHYFHSIASELRSSRIYMDNEPLVEYFDIHNSQHTCLNALLDNTIPEEEKNRYYLLTTSGKFYEDIRDWVNRTYSANWTRDDAKLYANKYHNIKNKSLERAKESMSSKYKAEACVDNYFETVFPNIRKFIYSNKDVLHVKLNQVETKLIIMNVCKKLYEDYEIEAVSVHDGIYMKKSAAEYLKANNISTENMFFEYLNIYEFI